jgi:hypothetical protein
MKSVENLNTGSTSRKIARNVFIGFAGFNGLIAGLLGVMTLVNMPSIFASLGDLLESVRYDWIDCWWTFQLSCYTLWYQHSLACAG